MTLGTLAQRIWYRDEPVASLIRALLLPAAALHRVGTALRNAAYDARLLSSGPLPLPAIGFGNLAVGGTGKTPLAAAFAAGLLERGVKVAVLLRGYGGDEAAVHELLAPGCVVIQNPDRGAGSRAALEQGCEALVLDDALQHRRVVPEAMVAVVAAETWRGVRWPLPSGPWREGKGALRRADLVAVTVKVARHEHAANLARKLASLTRLSAAVVAKLELGDLEAAAGQAVPVSELRGRRVLAVCGVGYPDAFVAQLAAAGASVREAVYGDHHRYTVSDVRDLVAAAPRDGLVVTTAKDAAKLRPLWPSGPGSPQLLVALQRMRLLSGEPLWEQLLERVATAARAPNRRTAAAPFAREQ